MFTVNDAIQFSDRDYQSLIGKIDSKPVFLTFSFVKEITALTLLLTNFIPQGGSLEKKIFFIAEFNLSRLLPCFSK